jgi:hypothetical protein
LACRLSIFDLQSLIFISLEAYHILGKTKKTRSWPRLVKIMDAAFAFSAGNNLLHEHGGDGVGKKEKAEKSLFVL